MNISSIPCKQLLSILLCISLVFSPIFADPLPSNSFKDILDYNNYQASLVEDGDRDNLLNPVWDIGNVIYDARAYLYYSIKGDKEGKRDSLIDFTADGVSIFIPFVPAGITKGVRETYKATKNIANGGRDFAKKQTKNALDQTPRRTEPSNLLESIFLKEFKKNPLEGSKKARNLELQDSRWPSSAGWEKRRSVMKRQPTSQEKRNRTKEKVVAEIHFNYNKKTGAIDDVKFKSLH